MPALIGGSEFNEILGATTDSPGATIAGGGASFYGPHRIAGVSPFATISGGSQNAITNSRWAVIGGGLENFVDSGPNGAGADFQTIGGGYRNKIFLPIQDQRDGNTIAGGYDNLITYSTSAHIRFAFIGGGYNNTNQAEGGAIGGGAQNRLGGWYSFVGSGARNSIPVGGDFAAIAGGSDNRIAGQNGFIGGGAANVMDALSGFNPSVIGGGRWNRVTEYGYASFIGGGEANTNRGGLSVIGGGQENELTGTYATIAGGIRNKSAWSYAAIGGGAGNQVTGNFGTIAGGLNNEANGTAFAAGENAKARHASSFVWAGGGSSVDTESFGSGTFTARAIGGVRFYTAYDTATGVALPAGGGAWSSLSDRESKENVKPVNVRDILDKVVSLPLGNWNYKSQSQSIRHIGPMAQDFRAAFGLGEDEKHISTVDADGVALAAIQGLNEKLREKDTEIAGLKERLAALEKSQTNRDEKLVVLERAVRQLLSSNVQQAALR